MSTVVIALAVSLTIETAVLGCLSWAVYRDCKQERRARAAFHHALYLSSPAIKDWLQDFKAKAARRNTTLGR